MSITAKEIEEMQGSNFEVLASMIQGFSRGSVVQDQQKSRSVSYRLNPAIVEEIEDFATKAGISKTAVVEMLLIDGIRKVKEQMTLNEELHGGEA